MVRRMVVVICFTIAPFHPFVHVRDIPELILLFARDRSKWPRCLLWHGFLPGLSTAGERDPWTGSLGRVADRSLEQVLGAYPVDHSGFWAAPDFWDDDDWLL